MSQAESQQNQDLPHSQMGEGFFIFLIDAELEIPYVLCKASVYLAATSVSHCI